MDQINKSQTKLYDLEDRTLNFSKDIIRFTKKLPNNQYNSLATQLIRASTSIGANYKEANETVTKKDFANKIKICLQECKESVYWLHLLQEVYPHLKNTLNALRNENMELVKIFAAIQLKIK
jgi:four helix bundle protein